MSMTRKQRAEAFTEFVHRLSYLDGTDCESQDLTGYSIWHNPWMKEHPDLLGEFMVFIKAFTAEVNQRFEEE